MQNENDKQLLTELYEAMITLETVEECKNFLSDLCTIKELQAMAQRLKSAKLLLDGKTYNEVIEETDISSATLARVSKCVRYGSGSYAEVIQKANARKN
jgi:TrpR-related protein YerC/YecD